MSQSFIVRLHHALREFNVQEALTLSDAMHAAELEGYEMTRIEERLWLELTMQIEAQR